MIDFIKKLYEQRWKDITIILLDDTEPDEDNSYNIQPNKLFMGALAVFIAFVGLTVLLIMVTPVGNLISSNGDSEIRAQVIEVSNKALALEDSLLKRDQQLQEMKNIIRLSIDTTLSADQRFNQLFDNNQGISNSEALNFDQTNSVNRLSRNEILFSNIAQSVPEFPARYPVQGSLTRRYEPDQEHFGLDIATKSNEPVINIADGVVVSSNWTINNGYVLSVQHNSGIVTMFKHLSKLNKKEGDLVLKGDILGLVGNAGVLSTGPHLHLEIWKDGIPQNPEIYLIK